MRARNPEAARPLEELGVRWNFAINSLVRRGILREVAFERYWLDENLWRELERRRRIATVILIAVGIVVVVLMLVFNG